MARLLAQYDTLTADQLLAHLATCTDELAALRKIRAVDMQEQWHAHWTAWEESEATSAAARTQEAEHAARHQAAEVVADNGNIAAIEDEIRLIRTILEHRPK